MAKGWNVVTNRLEEIPEHTESRPTGTDLHKILNEYDTTLAQIRSRDDLMPGPRARAIEQAKETLIKDFDAVLENLTNRDRGRYKEAYAKARPVPPKEIASSPYKAEIVQRLQDGADPEEMYRDFNLRGFDEGLKILRFYGPENTRGTQHEKLTGLFPDMAKNAQELVAVEREIDRTRQGVDLLRDAARRRIESEDSGELQEPSNVQNHATPEDVAMWTGASSQEGQ